MLKKLTPALLAAMRLCPDAINWTYISGHYRLSEKLIKKYRNYVDWYDIAMCQNLSEKFMISYADYLDWTIISRYQCLTADFVLKFKDKINWSALSRSGLNNSFVNYKDIAERLDWRTALRSDANNLSEDIYLKYMFHCFDDDLEVLQSNWKRQGHNVERLTEAFEMLRLLSD